MNSLHILTLPSLAGVHGFDLPGVRAGVVPVRAGPRRPRDQGLRALLQGAGRRRGKDLQVVLPGESFNQAIIKPGTKNRHPRHCHNLNSSCLQLNEMPFDVPDMYAKPGTPCNDYKGYCDVFQKCREVSLSRPWMRGLGFVRSSL